jgi:hypothetical protein
MLLPVSTHRAIISLDSVKGNQRSTWGYRVIEEEESISHGDRIEVTLRAFVIW